jgi:segregation and condensation protein A
LPGVFVQDKMAVYNSPYGIIAIVNLQVAAHQVEGYRVNTEIYEGPLDLLLQLIEHAELDITTLALAQVTDQYLAHIRSMQDQNAAEVSGFLVIAARLLQIKSAALLPRPSAAHAVEEEEDPGEALARQLIIYKRFKELSANLAILDARGQRTYLRLAPPPLKIEARLDLSGIGVTELVQAARDIFFNKPDLPALSRVVAMPRVTIREKIRTMLESLTRYPTRTFRSFLRQEGDRLEAIVTFLAMLELIKRRVVEAAQPVLFGDIEVTSTGEWDEKEDAQLEFIE